jgi:hypothetical protein
VRCRLLALSRDVSRPALDVTARASWRVTGKAGAGISIDGAIDAPADGDVEIDGQFGGRHVGARARLTPGRPGQMLATVRGHVYAETQGILRPVAYARVEVVKGPCAGLSTTTRDDGSYEFVGLVTSMIAIRAVKIGHTAGEHSIQLYPGENRLSLLIEALPPAEQDRTVRRAGTILDKRGIDSAVAVEVTVRPLGRCV